MHSSPWEGGLLNLGVDLSLFDDLRDETRNVTNFTLDAQIASVHAALERRKDEWSLQKRLGEQDFRIEEQQIKIANDHVQIVTQERTIAGIQADNDKDLIEFLTTKFINIDLYDWMSPILERVYSFFLRQATVMAKLSETQLGFLHQEVPPAIIKPAYWQALSEDDAVDSSKPVSCYLAPQWRCLIVGFPVTTFV